MTPAMSVWSWSATSRAPIDGEFGMMTRSSAANRPCQAKAQPCLRPATNVGSAAGTTRFLYRPNRRRPMDLPARSSSGGVKSTPAISPLAMDGAAVMMTMNRMAEVLLPNRMIANGIQTTDGIVCKPLINEPTAARTGGTRATTSPTALPTTRAAANPITAWRSVRPIAFHSWAVCRSCHSSGSTWPGPGRTTCGLKLAR